jgi:hypothetical protein
MTFYVSIECKTGVPNSNAMAQFSCSCTTFATRGPVTFNKYWLKKLFSRNICHFFNKKKKKKKKTGGQGTGTGFSLSKLKFPLSLSFHQQCTYHQCNSASFLKLRVITYTVTKFLPHFSSSRCFINMTCNLGHP